MKKLFTLVAAASIFTFVACGPSKEEMEKRINQYVKEIDKAITLLNG